MPALSNRLIAAWAWLAGLSGLAALIALGVGQGVPRRAAGAALLVLAVFKARVILARYLDLDRARAWLSGFGWAVTLWAALVLGLYLV